MRGNEKEKKREVEGEDEKSRREMKEREKQLKISEKEIKTKKGRKYTKLKTNCNSSFEIQAFRFLIQLLNSTFDLAEEFINALHI